MRPRLLLLSCLIAPAASCKGGDDASTAPAFDEAALRAAAERWVDTELSPSTLDRAGHPSDKPAGDQREAHQDGLRCS